MGGKNKASTQTATTAPWKAQQPFLKEGFQSAQNFFQNQTPFAPFSDVSQTAIGQAQSIYPQAGQLLGQTLGGEFLGDANPYLQDVVGRASRDVMSGLNATFGGAGRTGGGLHQQALGTALGDVATSVYAPAYEQERQRMSQAMFGAPSLIQGQLGTGQIIESKDLEEQLAPYTNLQRYMDIVGGGGYGGTQSTPVEGRAPLSGALGGALAGASLGAMEGSIGGPWGAAIGGGLGLLGVI